MKAKVTRIYAGSDGESHFEDIEIPLNNLLSSARRSDLLEATGLIFQQFDNHEIYWHNVPRRQFVIITGGALEIEVGGNVTRRFRAGDVLLAEDTTGRGHISRPLDNQPHKVVFVTLD